ncbi:LysR family transcriptional regulator [Marinimicrobium agarilyticum]|uniref:LysR family transcriptional regulator n=1 Tax=Marinimicrobium agarilyticum TaxID=306546 RepID=UPI0004292E43|nr:LysR family transcriptional regulator [Marinimicrobium agarilyticum]
MAPLRGIESFVKAVEAGSIAAGARILGISAAAASQNIARLETHLGVRLLTRTTRSLALTEGGSAYYSRVRELVQELELASQAVDALHAEPRGRLRVAATGAFARHVLAPMIPGFSRRYPDVLVELMVTDRNVNHIAESVDASIRIRPALEEGLIARPVAKVPSIFCASPEYLAKAGRPEAPEQLSEHDCLVFRFPVDGRILRWGFVRNGLRFDAPVRATLISDDIDTLAQMAVAGGGITRLGAFIAEPLIERGQLVELFTPTSEADVQAEIEPLEFYLCVRHRRELTPKVRAFSDYLVEQLPERWRV